jgi:hypothetical protein
MVIQYVILGDGVGMRGLQIDAFVTAITMAGHLVFCDVVKTGAFYDVEAVIMV